MWLVFCAFVSLFSVESNAQFRINLGGGSPLRKLQIAEMAINNLYVDTVNEEKLVEDAIRGMLKELDPHSTYANAKEVKAMNEPLQGNFDGIGVQFNMVEDTLLVIQPTTNGPSEKVGIVAGDRIVMVNDSSIAGVKMPKEEIRKRFGATTHAEFMEGIEKLQQLGMRDLILDLEDNGGGYLQSAVQIANEFLQKNDLIVYTEGLRTRRQEYRADGHGKLLSGKVIVLVNELTASAAEIVSGAIQDQDRGIIVGRRSFGKGLVQRPVDLPDGSMIRLTIAHYYTPAGRCIQKPYKKGDLKEYEMDFENRLKHGELTNRDSIHFADSLKCLTLRKQRTVYGGGGIMPDEFVPLDTLQYTKFHRQLAAKSIIINANLKYIDNNRKQLKKQYPTFESFRDSFQVPQSVIDGIMAEAEKQKVKAKDDAELQRTLPYLRLQLKALIARDLWDMNEYFQLMNTKNHIVQRALQLI